MTVTPQVLVTGATGFIGSKLVVELARRGCVVQALTRRTSDTTALTNERIRLFEGDILDLDSLRRAADGCTQVYHLAAYAKNWAREKETFFRLNVDGTRNILAAARTAGVSRVVYTSTIVTLRPTSAGTVGDETTPRTKTGFLTEYEATKSAAEREVLQMAASGLPAVVVNPTRVYGPGKLTEGNAVTQMIEDYLRGRLPVLLNHGMNVGNYALVDDLVRGHILAMEKGRVGERYILGGENVTLKRLFELVDEVSGARHRQFNLPSWAALLYSHLQKARAEWFGVYPRITPGWVDTFLRDWAFSCNKAERELGYRITPLKEGLRATCEWLQAERERRA